MEQIWELNFFRVTLVVREECPGIDERDLREVLRNVRCRGVDRLDFVGWPAFGGGGGKNAAERDGRFRVVFLDRGQDEFDIASYGGSIGTFFEVIGSHEHDYPLWIEGEDIVVESHEHSACGITADTAVRDFEPRETVPHIIAPALGDRIT